MEGSAAISTLHVSPLTPRLRHRTAGIRWIWSRRFPYRILYRVEAERVVVLAVLHAARSDAATGLSDRPHGGGAPRKLTEEQEAALAEWVRRGPVLETDGVVRWRVVDLRQKIAREFDVELHERSVGKLLRRLAAPAGQANGRFGRAEMGKTRS